MPVQSANLLLLAIMLLLLSCQPQATSPKDNPENWAWYQGGPDVNQYSELDQITVDNVAQLQVAWVYTSGDKDAENRSQIHVIRSLLMAFCMVAPQV